MWYSWPQLITVRPVAAVTSLKQIAQSVILVESARLLCEFLRLPHRRRHGFNFTGSAQRGCFIVIIMTMSTTTSAATIEFLLERIM